MKIARLIIIAVLLFAMSVLALQSAKAMTKEERILNLRRQIEELTRQAEQYRKNILEKHSEANTLEREVSILNNQISKLQTEIWLTSNKIEKTELEITGLENEIFNASQTIEQHKKAIAELMTSIYEQDQMGFIAMLLSNARLSDLASEAQRISKLNQRLSDIVSKLKEEKSVNEQRVNELAGKKKKLSTLNDQNINQRNSIALSKKQKDAILRKTKGEESKYQQLLSEVEQKQRIFFQELQALESEARETGSFIVHVSASNVPPRGTPIFKWPYSNFVMTQGYGYTSYAKRGAYGGAPHNGIDIVSGYGSPIHSIGDGNVLTAGFNNGFGNWVAIEHDNGMVSVYAHMNAPARLGNGTRIKAGDTVGFEGSTGNSTGSHLHLSLYKDFFTYIRKSNGQIYFNYFKGTVSPLDYLPRR